MKCEMYGFDAILLKTYPNWLGDRALNQLFTEMEQNQDSVHKVINPRNEDEANCRLCWVLSMWIR